MMKMFEKKNIHFVNAKCESNCNFHLSKVGFKLIFY